MFVNQCKVGIVINENLNLYHNKVSSISIFWDLIELVHDTTPCSEETELKVVKGENIREWYATRRDIWKTEAQSFVQALWVRIF